MGALACSSSIESSSVSCISGGALNAAINLSAWINREDWGPGCVNLSIRRSQSLESISVVLGEEGLLATTGLGENWQLDVSVDVSVVCGNESKVGVP